MAQEVKIRRGRIVGVADARSRRRSRSPRSARRRRPQSAPRQPGRQCEAGAVELHYRAAGHHRGASVSPTSRSLTAKLPVIAARSCAEALPSLGYRHRVGRVAQHRRVVGAGDREGHVLRAGIAVPSLTLHRVGDRQALAMRAGSRDWRRPDRRCSRCSSAPPFEVAPGQREGAGRGQRRGAGRQCEGVAVELHHRAAGTTAGSACRRHRDR